MPRRVRDRSIPLGWFRLGLDPRQASLFLRGEGIGLLLCKRIIHPKRDRLDAHHQRSLSLMERLVPREELLGELFGPSA